MIFLNFKQPIYIEAQFISKRQISYASELHTVTVATVRIGHGTTDWFQIGNGVCQGCILSPCLFNLYAEYIMRNTGLVQMVKNLPAMQETQVRSLGQEDPLEVDMATHSSILPWRIPIDRGAWQVTVHGVAKSQTRLSD